MRKPFIETLTKLAEVDDRIILVIGDVGFSFLEGFRDRFPKQFLNPGVLEQTMMGLVSGLARGGFKPAVYTMRNFIAFRPYEQVRNDLAFANADVMLFGVSGSVAYKFLGYSHNVIVKENEEDEDIRMLKFLPNMNVYIPKTEEELIENMMFEYKRIGPSYFVI